MSRTCERCVSTRRWQSVQGDGPVQELLHCGESTWILGCKGHCGFKGSSAPCFTYSSGLESCWSQSQEMQLTLRILIINVIWWHFEMCSVLQIVSQRPPPFQRVRNFYVNLVVFQTIIYSLQFKITESLVLFSASGFRPLHPSSLAWIGEHVLF